MLDKKMLEYARCAKDPVYFLNNYGYVFDAKKKKVDKMTCFPYQDTCVRRFHKEQNNIILKSRQCLPGDTYVDTPSGPKAIKDFKIGDEVYSYNLLSNEVEVDTVYDAWCSGDRQCVKFKLQDTRNFEVGENHPFYVKDKGWVKAKDLKRGDEIIDANFGFGDIIANEDEIKLLAYLITDGSTNNQVKFTNNNINYLGEFEESINNLFPELYIRKSPKLNGYDYFPHQEHGTSSKNPIIEWCETKEIANKKTEFKLLPKEVFNWDKKSTSILINRLFAGDGWISIYKKGENSKRLELGIGSPSEEFLHQIKSLLKKFDIKCNIYEVKNMKLQQNRFFKLRITHSKSAIRFVKNIGIFDKITQEHHDICDSYKHDVKDNSIIKKIEKTVIRECYDISVSENENFFVDGLLTHNTGLSVVTAGYVAWRLMFRYDEKILIIANDGAGAVRFLDTVKQFIEYVPDWMKPDAIETENQKKIMFSNNSYAEAKASSPNAGRGDSLTMLILDETAFIKDAEAIWMGAGMALSATGGKCIMISCVPKGTIVFTNKGIKKIDEFINEEIIGGYEVDEYRVFGKDKLRKGNLFFNNGLHETKLITTINAQVEGTLNHKLWACKDGVYDWYRMEELEIGDFISVQYGMESWGYNDDLSLFNPSDSNKMSNKFNPKKIDKNLAYLIGLYISEGSVYKKYNENGEFIGGSVTITCGDDISKAIECVGLSYSCYDGLHYSIGSKNLIEFFEYLGFDLSKKAKEKEIPSRVLEMSRENIIYMLRGIFDGDGYSRKDKGYIGIAMNSKILVQQIRMLLLNFGVLTDYCEVLTKPTKKVKVETLNFRITANGESSKVFYDKIGFGFERKQNNQLILEKYNLDRNNPNDVIPFSLNVLKKIVEESGLKLSYFKKRGIFVNAVLNKKKPYKSQHISRGLFISIFEVCKDFITEETISKVEKFLSKDLKWNSIKSIESSENETFDFSLPNNESDFWAHSVVYNGVLGHQTPNGTGNLYYKTWVDAINNANKFVGTTVHWTENPNSAVGLEWKVSPTGEKVAWSPWYEDQCKRLNWDSVKIAQELDLSFEGSKRLAVDPQLVEKYTKKVNADHKPEGYLKFDFMEKENPALFSHLIADVTNMAIFKSPEEGRQYIIGCLPPGEKVLTNKGLKNIEEVDFSDKLIDENGLEVDIRNIQITKDIDDYVYEIRPSNVYRKTKFTKDHPILACNDYKLKRNYNPNHDVYRFNERYWDLKFDFVNASELKIGDWLVYPNIYFGKDKNEEFIKSKFTQFSDNLREDFVIDENIVLDEEFWWFVGIWLAEGWVQSDDKYKYSVHTCHNLTEELVYVDRLDILFKKYGRNISTVIKEDCNTVETVFSSKQIYNFLISNFGKYADGKYISEWVKYIPENLKIKLLEGYLNGYGSWFKDSRRNNSTISYVSVSLELLESIQDILFSIGIISNLSLLRHEKESKIKSRIVFQKKTYQLTLCHHDSLRLIEKIGYEHDFEIKNNRTIKDCFLSKDNNFIYFRIKDFEKIKYEGDVYNFETETHTYLCRNITTHNCDVARGDGQDFSTIQVLDADTLEQVAEFREKISPDLFPYVINHIAKMYNMAYVVIEANSFGLGVCFDMRDKFKYPRNRLYFSKNIKDIHVRHYKYKVNEGTEIPGFQTSRKNRVLLIKAIIEHMREGSLILHSKRLMAEFQTFIMNGDKPEHEPGFNDDLILALGLALYIRDTEFENVTASTEMYKSMLNAMMLSTNSSAGMIQPTNKKVDIPNNGGGMFVFNGINNININPADLDDTSWLLD